MGGQSRRGRSTLAHGSLCRDGIDRWDPLERGCRSTSRPCCGPAHQLFVLELERAQVKHARDRGAAEALPRRARSGPGRSLSAFASLNALRGPRESLFRRFGVGLGWIFVEFWTIFRRFSLEPRATKAQKQNLKKESCDPQRTSWLLRCAVASYCSHVFRNDFRTLHVQPFFVAYPQAHLVIENTKFIFR